MVFLRENQEKHLDLMTSFHGRRHLVTVATTSVEWWTIDSQIRRLQVCTRDHRTLTPPSATIWPVSSLPMIPLIPADLLLSPTLLVFLLLLLWYQLYEV